jgi:hypothetical protein
VSTAIPEDGPWLDGDAGRLVRPYTVSNGRTRPTNKLDLLSMVIATGRAPRTPLDPDRAEVLDLCDHPTSVAELAARLRLPAIVTKVLLSDLLDYGAVTMRVPSSATDPTDRFVLETLLDALQQRI